MRDTNAIGDLAQAKIIARLLELGYRVCTPFGDGYPYDLIADDGETLSRIQCKNAVIRKGCIVIKMVSTSGHAKNEKTYVGRADAILAYCAETDKVYKVPITIDSPVSKCYLRVDDALSNRGRTIRHSKDYEL